MRLRFPSTGSNRRQYYGCTCGKNECWVVTVRNGNFSAFNGYRFTPSDYSKVTCAPERGGCGAVWRTKAAYVDALPDASEAILPTTPRESGTLGP